MDPNGDITDAFDDDLTQSIEQGGKEGPWNDETATFMDPELKKLQAQLQKAKPDKKSYQQRRLEEMQQRAQEQGRTAPRAPRARPQASTDSGPIQWGETTQFDDGTTTAEAATPPVESSAKRAPQPKPTAPQPIAEPEPASASKLPMAVIAAIIVIAAAAAFALL